MHYSGFVVIQEVKASKNLYINHAFYSISDDFDNGLIDISSIQAIKNKIN